MDAEELSRPPLSDRGIHGSLTWWLSSCLLRGCDKTPYISGHNGITKLHVVVSRFWESCAIAPMVDVATLGKGLNLSFNLDWPSFSPPAQESQGFGEVMASCTSLLDRSEHRGCSHLRVRAFHFNSSTVIANWQVTNRFASPTWSWISWSAWNAHEALVEYPIVSVVCCAYYSSIFSISYLGTVDGFG